METAHESKQDFCSEGEGERLKTVAMAKKALLHPIDFFHDMRDEGNIHYYQAFILLVIVLAVHSISLSTEGFLFQRRETDQISFVSEILTILILFFTWCIANWGISTIRDGEGSFKEIVVGSSFALIPYIVFAIPLSIVSNVMGLEEGYLYTGATGFVLLWVGYLLIMNIKIIHDFELYELLLILFLSLVGMLIIWFVMILIYGLLNQLVNFIIGIIMELGYRL